MHQPFAIILFGATGDLAHRKLIPALYSLLVKGEIAADMVVVGVGRRQLSTDEFRADMEQTLRDRFGPVFNVKAWKKLADHMDYQQGFFEDATLYASLAARLETIDKKQNTALWRFFYLATPPEHYETILRFLGTSGLAKGGGDGLTHVARILIEKPFGKDLKTAQELERLLAKIFKEEQIYRIDHYLGKETVQNILSFRFANGIFEPTWNSGFIDHVQIALLEEEGVGARGTFYDGVGALRDVVQNHVLQMLAVTAMDQPRAFDAMSIRDERAKVLASIECIEPNDVMAKTVRGQYDGYRKVDHIDPASKTETYVGLKLHIDSSRWKGVPFYLRTGKKLGASVAEISIHYKKPVVCMGEICLFPEESVLRNVLSIRIQPDDGISVRLMVKKPGFGMKLTSTQMNFHYRDAFPDFEQPEAYEKLLIDAMSGDQMLFARTDGVLASWQVVTKILAGWSEQKAPLYPYAVGSMGPPEADTFIKRDGRHWFVHTD
ncbi:glucose-6-phosphate dehydrogenase [Candidatus Gottesmanbacteria bacterium]|nr:glucose-6-phosphate dehydrogenase [Candidatus Gottesmanbacteria bacterium]